MRLLTLAKAVLACITASAPILAAPISIGSSTAFWNPVSFGVSNQNDFNDDEQTGRKESDIVGDTTHSGFYFAFDSAGTPATTDGEIAFRVRLGSDFPTAGSYERAFFVGIDADGNGSIDLFVGIDSTGSNSHIRIWNPGAGANTGPSTTTVVNPALRSYAQNATNYHFSPVNAATDPAATDFDLDDDGDTDQFLSFKLPFADFVADMASQGKAINDQTLLRFVIITSNQTNALNQDIGGVNGGTSSTSTWSQLGAFSPQLTADVSVPEPTTLPLTCLALTALVVMLRRQSPAGALAATDLGCRLLFSSYQKRERDLPR
jgi:hypothetical protein